MLNKRLNNSLKYGGDTCCQVYFQEELVEFFRLQMAVHHPEGASTEEQGAFSLDWDLWKVCGYFSRFQYTSQLTTPGSVLGNLYLAL